ncbi:MAG: response regulator [Anaerolineales bacterium]|nr:response regulator [Anaerolineales bacterium]
MSSKVLIVDDEPTALTTLEAILSGEGYQLEYAASGKIALEKAEQLLPDLILLDVMMPGMNGFEVCRRLRATPKLAEVPIIILTALDDRSSRLQGIEAGADDFLIKPVDRQELQLRVRTILRLDRYRTLSNQRENLRKMAEHVVNAQEQERKRLSRELHDDLGQALIAHMLRLQNLRATTPPRVEDLHRELDDLIADTNQTINKMRQLAQDIRPTMLDTLGLKTTLQNHCREYSIRTGLPVTLEIDEKLSELSDIYSIILYRFLQETLTNVIKHSKANHVWVELTLDEEEITLTVQDNGKGFTMDDSHTAKGIGLMGLRERLLLVGGNLVITSAPSKGTIISAHLPVNEKSTREQV